MLCKASQDKWVIVESSNKMRSTEGENGKPLQYSCHEKPTNSMIRQKDKMPEDEPPRLAGVQYTPGEEQRAITNSSRKKEASVQSGNDTQLCMCPVVKVKSNVVKNNIA